MTETICYLCGALLFLGASGSRADGDGCSACEERDSMSEEDMDHEDC